MTTVGPTAYYPDANTTSSNANVRAWVSFISGIFGTTAGWTQSADAGQINLATFTGSGLTATLLGYQIWKTADGVGTQFYVKIEYYTGSTAGWPRIYITIGTGSNGSGTLTGQLSTRNYVQAGSTTTATNYNCYGAGGTGWITCNMFANASYNFGFAIERLKTSAGAEDTTGIVLYMWGSSSTVTVLYAAGISQVVLTSGATQNTIPYWPICGYAATRSSGGNVGVSAVQPVANQLSYPDGLAVMLAYPGDIGGNTTMTVPRYGSNHTYLQVLATGIVNDQVQYGYNTISGNPAAGNYCPLIRFE